MNSRNVKRFVNIEGVVEVDTSTPLDVDIVASTTLDVTSNSQNIATETTLSSANTKLDTVNTNISSTNTKLDTSNSNLSAINTNITNNTNTKIDATTSAISSGTSTLNTTLGTLNTSILSLLNQDPYWLVKYRSAYPYYRLRQKFGNFGAATTYYNNSLNDNTSSTRNTFNDLQFYQISSSDSGFTSQAFYIEGLDENNNIVSEFISTDSSDGQTGVTTANEYLTIYRFEKTNGLTSNSPMYLSRNGKTITAGVSGVYNSQIPTNQGIGYFGDFQVPEHTDAYIYSIDINSGPSTTYPHTLEIRQQSSSQTGFTSSRAVTLYQTDTSNKYIRFEPPFKLPFIGPANVEKNVALRILSSAIDATADIDVTIMYSYD